MDKYPTLAKLLVEFVKETARSLVDRPQAAENLLQIATSSYNAGYESLSALILRRAAVVADDPGLLFTDLGQLYYSQGDYEKAQHAFEQAVAEDFWNVEALRGLGLSLHQLGDYDGASYYYLAVLAEEEDDFNARFNLGIIYHAQGRLEDAVDQFQIASKNNPEFVDGYVNLGKVYYDNGEFEKAEKAFNRAIELDPESEESYYFLGWLHLALDRLPEAMNDFQQTVQLNPDNGLALVELSSILTELGEADSALSYAQKSLQLFEEVGSRQDQARSWWVIGWAYYMKNQWDEAVSAARRSLELDSSLIAVRFNLGLALLRSGNIKESRRVYEEATNVTDMWNLENHGITDLKQALDEVPNLPGAGDILSMLEVKLEELITFVHKSSKLQEENE